MAKNSKPAGAATPPADATKAAPTDAGTVEAVVLVDSWLGRVGSIVKLDAAIVVKVKADGYVDDHPTALAQARKAL